MNTRKLKKRINFNSDYELSPSEKRELDEQQRLHLAGKTKSYTLAEVREHAIARLKINKKKK
jgi:hypothetical protein